MTGRVPRESNTPVQTETRPVAPRLNATERRSLVLSSLYRVIGTPVVALSGVISAGLIIRATGESAYGLVSMVATVGLLIPFVDLGIGAVVTNAVSQAPDPARDRHALDVVRRAYRVLTLISLGVALSALVVMTVDAWEPLLGLRTGGQDRWAITAAVIIFGFTIPAGLGLRMLIGADRNELAVLVMMASSILGLIFTVIMYAGGVRGIWFVLPSLTGALVGNLIGTALALRVTGIGGNLLGPVTRGLATRDLLEGSMWLFFVSVGIPFGLQVQRIVLSHQSTPEQLSKYALMAQMYGLAWSVFSTAALSFWPIFAKRRDDPAQTTRLWLRTTLMFGAGGALCALGMTVLGPWAGNLLSGDTISISSSLAAAFAVLLIVQCLHLPSGVLLVGPSEARWQTLCIGAMALTSVVAATAVAAEHGAVGVVVVTAIAVLFCQVFPDLLWVPRLIRRPVPETFRARQMS
jgi:O-antigen/teichoic acid export membrane protein